MDIRQSMRNAVRIVMTVLVALVGCSAPTEQHQDAGFYPIECPDNTPYLGCGDDLNEFNSLATPIPMGRRWFAFKYRPATSFSIGRVCISAPLPETPVSVYLLNDNAGAPGDVLKGGPLYSTDSHTVCTLGAPFDFTAGVEGLKTYWIASDVVAPFEALSGASVPYWDSDTDPSGAATWTSNCSANFIVKIEPKGTCQ